MSEAGEMILGEPVLKSKEDQAIDDLLSGKPVSLWHVTKNQEAVESIVTGGFKPQEKTMVVTAADGTKETKTFSSNRVYFGLTNPFEDSIINTDPPKTAWSDKNNLIELALPAGTGRKFRDNRLDNQPKTPAWKLMEEGWIGEVCPTGVNPNKKVKYMAVVYDGELVKPYIKRPEMS